MFSVLGSVNGGFIWHRARFTYQRALIVVPVVYLFLCGLQWVINWLVYVTMLPSSGTSQTLYSNYSCYAICVRQCWIQWSVLIAWVNVYRAGRRWMGGAIKHRPECREECLITCHDSVFAVMKLHFMYVWIVHIEKHLCSYRKTYKSIEYFNLKLKSLESIRFWMYH